MTKLCLGTAQFGMNYGIHNKKGQLSEEECFEMLDIAIEKGVDAIDTASVYGTAEKVVGDYLAYRRCQDKVKVVSKFDFEAEADGQSDAYSIIRRELEKSLERLQVCALEGYLLHTSKSVYDDETVSALLRLKDENLIRNAGVSIYHMEEGFKAVSRGMDYVQLPYSVMDQRGYHSGLIAAAKKAGMTVFTRSAFLQGLFMMETESLPERLKPARKYLKHFRELTGQYGRRDTEVLLKFVKETQGIDYLVFGADGKDQLLRNLEYFEGGRPLPRALLKELREYYRQVDDQIILPSLWTAKNLD